MYPEKLEVGKVYTKVITVQLSSYYPRKFDGQYLRFATRLVYVVLEKIQEFKTSKGEIAHSLYFRTLEQRRADRGYFIEHFAATATNLYPAEPSIHRLRHMLKNVRHTAHYRRKNFCTPVTVPLFYV